VRASCSRRDVLGSFSRSLYSTLPSSSSGGIHVHVPSRDWRLCAGVCGSPAPSACLPPCARLSCARASLDARLWPGGRPELPGGLTTALGPKRVWPLHRCPVSWAKCAGTLLHCHHRAALTGSDAVPMGQSKCQAVLCESLCTPLELQSGSPLGCWAHHSPLHWL
jgi:hypothetical protein